MGNIDNFKGNTHKLTADEQSAAGKKSGETRRAKKELKRAIELLLEREFTDNNGDVYSGAEVLAVKLFEKAKKGDVRAFEVLRDTAGQKPTEQIEINSINPETVAEVEEMIKNAKERHNRDTTV